jgi:hypothetical protein
MSIVLDKRYKYQSRTSEFKNSTNLVVTIRLLTFITLIVALAASASEQSTVDYDIALLMTAADIPLNLEP